MRRSIRALALTLAALTVAAAPTALSGTAVAASPGPSPAGSGIAAPRLALPEPTGASAVGRDTLHLVDKGRKDPWVPTADRELLLSLYYPARAGTGRPASYMTVPEATALLTDRGALGRYVTAEQVSATRTYARDGARPLAGRHPLVVLSPGFTVPRTTLTSLAEELASRGYVVAAVDHAYETDGTSFPGGRLLGCAACEQISSMEEMGRVSDGRAKDISFVLDRLTGPRAVWRYAELIDPRRIGAAGHSIGGASTAAVMAADRRVKAGVNLDGTFFTPVPERGLDGRPYLMLGGDPALLPPDVEDHSWEQAWQRLDGWKRWLTVTGAGHFAFTDWPVLGEQAGDTDPGSPLSGTRSQQITRAYVGAFFDHQLRGRPAPLLDGPSAANPEVVFQP
ncbi:alpha/beta hydrolase [Streptomyces sp. NPDC047097]|uniref:alpha/beta hydrolase family protein n=1 Tax=Streptomyces sp. NPDC047097 TaxID=3155260 RepID=UPI0033C0BED3